MNALLLIDLQYDFLPGGSLAVPEGDQVLSVACEWMKKRDRFSEVIATQDWHPAHHLSFASQHRRNDGTSRRPGEIIDLQGLPQVLWPDHCVQETRGAELASALFDVRERNGVLGKAIDFISQKGMNREVDSYSGFFDNGRRVKTQLDDHLKARGIKKLAIMGLATDYCVKFTVLDALHLGYEVEVVQAGCRGVNLKAGDSQAALQAMSAAGACLI